MPTSFFQSCFGPSFPQFAGEIFSLEIPSRLMPRHCGQSTACAKGWAKKQADTASDTSEEELFMTPTGTVASRAVNAPPSCKAGRSSIRVAECEYIANRTYLSNHMWKSR